MPYLKTPEELAEERANLLGIYNQGIHADHDDGCQCRECWNRAIHCLDVWLLVLGRLLLMNKG